MPRVIHAEYRVTSPLFIGDVNQQATVISPASFKGALRFWWRAINWGQCIQKTDSPEKALQRLHQQEGFLFGSSAEQGTGQARFTLRLKTKKLPIAKSDWPKSGSDSGYLGMGLWESGRKEKNNFQAARQYLSENTDFTVDMVIHPSLSEQDSQSLQDALRLLGLLGGLGSRSRRAFGSLALLSLNQVDHSFSTIPQYQDSVANVLSRYPLAKEQPPYSAFSQAAQIGINRKAASTARLAHGKLGSLFKQHRGQESNLRGSKKRVFGMPYSGGGIAENKARRASPLLMHIHPIGNQYHSVCTFLPATFHYESPLESVDFDLVSQFVSQFEEVAIA